jgi:hypothetical protein
MEHAVIRPVTVALGLAGVLVAVSPATSVAAIPTDGPAVPQSAAAETVAACTKDSGRLLVDIEIDRSGSLAGTDPEDRRVDGVGSALIGLARLAEREDRDGRKPRVEVLLSSFAGTVKPADPAEAWRVVNDASLDGLVKQAERYGERDHGRDTDYALALGAAQSALEERAAAIVSDDQPEPCKVLVFLSDGRFHLGDRTDSTSLPTRVPYAPGVDLGTRGGGAKAVAAGRRFLCRSGGLRDRMVGNGITMFTVALSASPEFTQEDRDYLEALTTGGSSGIGCGSALSERTGQFVEVRNNLDLFFVFAYLIWPSGPAGPCEPGQCPNPSQFRTFPGIRGFTLSASASLPGVELELTAPDQERTILRSDGATDVAVDGASVSQHWIRSRSLDVQARFDPDSQAWLGLWGFRFFTPDSFEAPVPVYDLTLQSGLRPKIVGGSELVAGAHSEVRVKLVDQAGHPVSDGPLARSARLHAEAEDGADAPHSATARRVGDGVFTVEFEVPEEVPDGDWTIALELSYPGTPTPVESGLFSLPLPAPDTGGDPPPVWLVLVIGAGMLLALLACTLLISYRLRRAEARFTAPQALRVFGCQAEVRPGSEVEFMPEPGALGLGYDDFEPVKRSGRDAKAARLAIPPFVLRTRVPWRWRAKAVGEASVSGRQILAGRKTGPLPGSADNAVCTVPLAPAGTWLFAVGSIDEADRVRGDLVIFTDDDSPPELGNEVLEAARAALLAQDWDGFDRQAPPEGTSSGWEELHPSGDIDDVDWESI